MQTTETYNGTLGLDQCEVCLHAHTPEWATLYTQEAQRIGSALGPLVVDIQHYGSTAIAGIKAKPILDLLVGIGRLDDGLLCIAPLATLGYAYVPQADIPNDHIFGKGVPRTHLVHVVAYESSNWTNGLRFRNALRANPALAREYEALKIVLQQQFAHHRAAYTAAKAPFIQRVLAEYT